MTFPPKITLPDTTFFYINSEPDYIDPNNSFNSFNKYYSTEQLSKIVNRRISN